MREKAEEFKKVGAEIYVKALDFQLVAGGNKPGHEVEHPLAVVTLGGLVTSTILNLFLMPTLYLRFGKGSRDAGGDSAR